MPHTKWPRGFIPASNIPHCMTYLHVLFFSLFVGQEPLLAAQRQIREDLAPPPTIPKGTFGNLILTG